MLSLAPYRNLFTDRQLRGIVLSSILPRLPVGMNALGLTLLVQSHFQSFALAGWVSSLYLLALAVQAPVIGRYMDRHSPRRVVLPLALAHALALLALVWAVMSGQSLGWVLLAAFVAGLFFPPITMTMRAMVRKADWPPAVKQSAFALESVVMESCFILGPLAVSLALLAGSPAYAVLASVVCVVLGTVLFVRSGALERWGQVEHGVQRHWLGPLRSRGVRMSLGLGFIVSVAIGLNEMALPGYATAHGMTSSVGWFYAAMSVPSALAGVAYGGRRWQWPLNRQILLTVLWLALGSLAMASAPSPPWFTLACGATGLAFGPMITALTMQLGALAPSEYATEAFTWSATLFMIGLGLGFWAGGTLVERHGWPSTLIAATVGLMLAAAWCPLVPPLHAGEP